MNNIYFAISVSFGFKAPESSAEPTKTLVPSAEPTKAPQPSVESTKAPEPVLSFGATAPPVKFNTNPTAGSFNFGGSNNSLGTSTAPFTFNAAPANGKLSISKYVILVNIVWVYST